MRCTPALAALLLAVVASPAYAQLPRKIPPVVFDIRGFYSPFGQDPITARDLDVTTNELPRRGWGGAAGLHLYPLRKQNIALGVGGEGVLMSGHAQQEDEMGHPVGDPIKQRIRGLAGQLSLNFGHKAGWSYLSAGMGPMSFATYQGETAPVDPAPAQMTIDMGAGARWFFNPHLAFTFDLRFYLTRPEEINGVYPGRQRHRLAVWSAGISFQ